MDGVEKKNERRIVVGRRLREAREGQGSSLKEAEQAITVHAHHLEALERGDFEALPSPVWARAFLVMYANHLGLEGEELIRGLFPNQRQSQPESHPKRRWLWLPKRRWRWLLAALGAVGAGATITVAAIVAPYDAPTDPVSGALHRLAPETFLGSEPQRIAVLALAEGGTSGRDEVLVVKVAEDGLGLLSIPDNTSTQIPGHGQGEIGDAFALGGADLTRRSAARLAGVEVPHYCVIGAEGIGEIVGAMGGVLIDVPRPVSGRAAPGGAQMTLAAGPQKLDGDQALVYLQGTDLPNDAERAERRQGFLYAMFRQALGPSNLLTNPTTLSAVAENTETNMSSAQMVQLAGRIGALRGSAAPLETGAVPGRESPAPPGRPGGAGDSRWVPDARELPDVLEETIR